MEAHHNRKETTTTYTQSTMSQRTPQSPSYIQSSEKTLASLTLPHLGANLLSFPKGSRSLR